MNKIDRLIERLDSADLSRKLIRAYLFLTFAAVILAAVGFLLKRILT